jgi:hypothetical protein
MANYSIPNSTPAIGRTSTPFSRRSRRQNSGPACFSAATVLAHAIWPWPFSSLGRVKGAWWSSRSSKPLSVPYTRNRGRFDSYPLRRLFNAQLRRDSRARRSTLNTQRSIQTVERWALDVGRWMFPLRLNHCKAEIKDPAWLTLSTPQHAIRDPQFQRR